MATAYIKWFLSKLRFCVLVRILIINVKVLRRKFLDKLNIELLSNQVESLLLEVRADNVAAIALYEQQEFALIHKRKGYYQTPHQPAIDALIMQRLYVRE